MVRIVKFKEGAVIPKGAKFLHSCIESDTSQMPIEDVIRRGWIYETVWTHYPKALFFYYEVEDK